MALGQALPPMPVLAPHQRPDRSERRRLARHDVLSARLAELHRIHELLDDAGEIVGRGWVQHAWFAYQDEVGRTRLATATDLHLMSGRPVVGACLVGAVVEAGGGLPAVHTQLVDRALGVAWHTLHGAPGTSVRWCPSPPERAVQVRALTSWNDARGRTAADVASLLHAATGVATAEIGKVRQERSQFV
jgi:hypothetical protein